jgi:hypothetical protein
VSKTGEDPAKEEEKSTTEAPTIDAAAADSSSEDEEIFGLSNELKMKTLSTKAR